MDAFNLLLNIKFISFKVFNTFKLGSVPFALSLILISLSQFGIEVWAIQHSSLQSSSVELMTWGKDTIIHRGRKDIYLSHYSPQYSVVVLMVNEVPWTQSDLPNLSGQFKVHAPSGQGVIAVTQVINLRRNSTHFTCIDYLKFTEPGSGVSSSKICGTLSKENKEFMPEDMQGPRVFHSPSGVMQVEYKSDKGSPSSSTYSSSDLAFHMVEVVFTAYKDCELSEESEGALRKCGDKCISAMNFCDERINCGFEEDFALDEVDCGGGESEILSQGKVHSSSEYLINLYLGGGVFILIVVAVAVYHHKRTYRRIQNIPHK